MAVCEGCGKRIRFIKTVYGKRMPVDADPVTFVPDMNGKNIYVMEDGQTVYGCEAREEDPDKHTGYVSHFATCPKADLFRKKGKVSK